MNEEPPADCTIEFLACDLGHANSPWVNSIITIIAILSIFLVIVLIVIIVTIATIVTMLTLWQKRACSTPKPYSR